MSSPRSAAVMAAVLAALGAQRSLADSTLDTGGGSAGPATGSGLTEVVVSATRTPQPRDKTGSSVTVIGAGQLQMQQTVFLSDVLAEVPGVALARNGGPGQTTSLYLRGAEPGQSIVLIDGVRLNDPGAPDGSASLGDLLVNDIERIEVLRGPQSTLYGSDAIGGVVDILTRRGGPSSVRLQADGGTFDSYRTSAAADGAAGPVEYGSAVNYYDTRGVSAADALRGNGEPDGDRNFGATANVRVRATEALSLDLRGFYIRSRTDIDGYPPPSYTFQDDAEFGRYRLQAGYAGINFSTFDDAWTHRVALIASGSDRRFFGVFDAVSAAFSPAENFYARGNATRWEYQGIIEPDARNEVTYGAETELSTLDTESLVYDSAPTRGRDRLSGYYAQWQTDLSSQLTATLGARADHDQQFGGHASYKAALAWQLGSGSVLRGNYATGFKSPTLYQFYSQYRNPLQTLAPETARGWELGYEQLLGPGTRLAATYFERTERDRIDYFDCSVAAGDAGCLAQLPRFGYAPGYYYNVGRAATRGFEAELTGQVARGLDAWINYTRLRAMDELTGLELARRPGVAASGGITWQAASASSLGASVTYEGPRYDDAANTVPLPRETTLNLFAIYALSQRLQLLARVDNLFKDRKEPVYGYGAPGRAFYAGARVSL